MSMILARKLFKINVNNKLCINNVSLQHSGGVGDSLDQK